VFKSVFLKTLRDQRRSLIYWGIGLAATALLMTLYYPSIRSIKSLAEYIDQLPKGIMEMFTGGAVGADFGTPEGFFNTELFGLIVPLLLLVYGVGFGAGSVAGEEEQGTLDFTLAYPVKRSTFVIHKFGVMTAGLLALGVFFWAGMAIGIRSMNIDLNLMRVAEETLNSVLLAAVFSSLALFIGCLRGSKGLSMGVAGGLATLTYLLNGLSALVEGLKPYRVLSPFYHYITPNTLVNGLNAEHALVLLCLTAVFFVAPIPVFDRRDIRV
jgi:ABC-2 type transport system permease protein